MVDWGTYHSNWVTRIDQWSTRCHLQPSLRREGSPGLWSWDLSSKRIKEHRLGCVAVNWINHHNNKLPHITAIQRTKAGVILPSLSKTNTELWYCGNMHVPLIYTLMLSSIGFMVRLRSIPEVALLVARIPSHESAPLEIPCHASTTSPQLHCTALCKRTWRKACTLSALCWSWGKFDAFWVQHSTIRVFQDENARL